jgi:hypothetical protein
VSPCESESHESFALAAGSGCLSPSQLGSNRPNVTVHGPGAGVTVRDTVTEWGRLAGINDQ